MPISNMTPINVILIFFLIQIAGYILLDKYNLKNWKYLILGGLLVSYIFVLPSYFIPNNPTNELRCGMPALAITLGFWIFGCGTALITHFTYIIIRNINKKTSP
jgi:hypothetical protein